MKRRDYILMASAMNMKGWLSTYGDEADFPTEKYHEGISKSCLDMAESMADEAEKRGYLENEEVCTTPLPRVRTVNDYQEGM